jgi:integrase
MSTIEIIDAIELAKRWQVPRTWIRNHTREGYGNDPILGVDDSVIQRILRHSNVAITQACYIKTASEDAKAAMQKLETALNDTHVTPRQLDSGTKAVM